MIESRERGLVKACGVLLSEQGERTIARKCGVAAASLEIPPGDGVMRELRQMRATVHSVTRLEGFDRQPVQPQAPAGREPLVEGVPDQNVRESELTGAPWNLGYDTGGDRLVQRLEPCILRHAGYPS